MIVSLNNFISSPCELVSVPLITTEHMETIPLPCLPETQRYDRHWREIRGALNV